MPLTTRFLASYLVGQAKTGISSLALMRHFVVNYRTTWLIHNKIMRAMGEQEDALVLREMYRLMMSTWAENTVVAKYAWDQRTMFRSLHPSRLMMQAIPSM